MSEIDYISFVSVFLCDSAINISIFSLTFLYQNLINLN